MVPVNGQSTLSAWLDNRPIQIMDVGTNAMQWRTFLELTPGSAPVAASALHPSGFYTAWATNSFTNDKGLYQVAADSATTATGNITNRIWRNASGAINRTQSLSCDAKGRLRAGHANATPTTPVSSGRPSMTGWSSGWPRPPCSYPTGCPPRFPRRWSIRISIRRWNSLELGVSLSSAPEVEFLEAGTSPSIQTDLEALYGPDLNGTYGGENGTGGFEGVSPYLNPFSPVISDARGNILAEVTNGRALLDAVMAHAVTAPSPVTGPWPLATGWTWPSPPPGAGAKWTSPGTTHFWDARF